MKHSVRVLLVAEGGGWTAIGLELWTTAQAKTIRDAVNAFMQILAADLSAHEDPGVEPIPAAPADLVERFEKEGIAIETPGIWGVTVTPPGRTEPSHEIEIRQCRVV